MTFQVDVGTWFVPLIFTIITMIWVFPRRGYEREKTGGMFPDFAYEIGLFLRGVIAIILSLFAWLIWALLR